MLKNLKPISKENNEFFYKNPGTWTCFKKIVLHDQEPLSFVDAANTYRQHMIENKNHARSMETIDFYDSADIFAYAIRSGVQTILCHSEKNSNDIKMAVDDAWMIECYYWYHGMIARDWFRHWQHHPDLMPCDRSAAPYRFMMYARGLTGTREYRKKFIDMMRSYQNQMLYDWDQSLTISPEYSAKIDVEDANQSAIHVVLETLFDTEKIHLTEKIFKPMVMSQPFLLLSGPGSLQYLRDYGFQTFGDFWDESYDNVTDSTERMILIEREIAKLSSLSKEDFQILYKSLLPVIIHNREHFFSQSFQDICIKEMRYNFNRAFDIQKENLFVYPGGPFARMISKFTEANIFLSDLWTAMARDFINSDYLSVPQEKILQKYPNLSVYCN